ncbi:MAG: hypothetical protein LBF66_00190 [Holosporales bacterium]|jgi:hypothetical protein|nr:hypothetical protein [Holosporales bacterium]
MFKAFFAVVSFIVTTLCCSLHCTGRLDDAGFAAPSSDVDPSGQVVADRTEILPYPQSNFGKTNFDKTPPSQQLTVVQSPLYQPPPDPANPYAVEPIDQQGKVCAKFETCALGSVVTLAIVGLIYVFVNMTSA